MNLISPSSDPELAAETQTVATSVEGKLKADDLVDKARTTRTPRWHRRALFGLATCALVSSTATFAAMRAMGFSQRDSRGRAQSGGGPTYTPPTWWDTLPPPIKNFYLTWDQLVWTFEQDPTDLAALRATLRTVMQTPGFDELKHKIIGFMSVSLRSTYSSDLSHGLLPGAASPSVHASLFAGLSRLVAALGGASIDQPTRQALLAYRVHGLAPDPSVREAFDLLMSELGL